MGGGGGGGPSDIGDIQSLIDRAKKELREGEEQGRRNVFISFAYEDIDEVNLLRAQAKNEKSPIEFNDWSVSEPIDSDRAPYLKQKIRERIEQSSLTVVYLSDKTAKSRWVDWEIKESVSRGKHVIGVFSRKLPPSRLPSAIIRNKISCIPWSKLEETIDRLK
jgi:glycerophosphoryl diester phosphodiesterase